MASLKEIRQRVGWAIARAENTIEEAQAQAGHLRQIHDELTARIEGEPDVLTPSAAGVPTFADDPNGVFVSWAAADRVTRYLYLYGATQPLPAGGTTDGQSVIVDLAPGDTFRVIPENEHGYGLFTEAVYE